MILSLNQNIDEIPLKKRNELIIQLKTMIIRKNQYEVRKEGNNGTMPWAGRAFKSLDSENRGYLFKHELLNHIKKGGVYTHH